MHHLVSGRACVQTYGAVGDGCVTPAMTIAGDCMGYLGNGVYCVKYILEGYVLDGGFDSFKYGRFLL